MFITLRAQDASFSKQDLQRFTRNGLHETVYKQKVEEAMGILGCVKRQDSVLTVQHG